MARIAVTGGNGFAGRHIVRLLLQEGHEVRVLTRSAVPMSRAEESSGWRQGDVRNPEDVRSLLRGCNMVVHLAASFSPTEDVAGIVAEGAQNVVRAAREEGLERLVLMSCMGADAAARSSFYAAKWRAEQLVKSSEVPHTILRPSLVLGPGDGVTGALADLIRAFPVVPVAGRGQYRQQPIDVEDLAECVSRALTIPQLSGETVSVGGPMFITFRQLVDLVTAEIGVVRSKLLLPYRSLQAFVHVLPASSRPLFQQPRLAQFQHGVVASPGIVQRMFGFEPRSVVSRLPQYLV